MLLGADKIPLRHDNTIVYGDDTIQIESVNEKYKLLFMEKDLINKDEKFRILFEYR